MNEIITVLISAGTGAFISGIFALISKKIDNSRLKAERQERRKDSFYSEKKDAYLKALNKLLYLKKGFSITSEQLRIYTPLSEERKEEIKELKNVDSCLRLYTSDRVFDFYYKLIHNYKRFAYASENDARLTEESKVKFDCSVTMLSRLMQEDLGYRQYDDSEGLWQITCPVCSREHDFVKTCKCGLTYEELEKLLSTLEDETEEEQQQITPEATSI